MWLTNLLRIISYHGGLFKTLKVWVRVDEVKIGHFMGMDCMGNRYYENPYYFYARHRWVIFSERFGYDYDASQIHPYWFRWLHCMTDLPPYDETDRVSYEWMLPYTENPTGTKTEFVPYSTTLPKIIPWKPPATKCTKPIKPKC